MAELTRRLFVTSCLVSVAAACSRPNGPAALVSGIDLAGMDRTVKPGADFWNYANGTWLRTTEIPADRSATGGGLEAQEETDRNMQQLIDGILHGHPAPNSDEARIANYYNAFLNTQAIDAAGMTPAQADLARFAAIQSRSDLSRVLGEQIRADTDPLNATNFFTENLFGIFVTQGLATPGEVLPYIMQGGIGLPEREYYFSDQFKPQREAYRAYMERTFKALGNKDPKAAADAVFNFETNIAYKSWKIGDRRDVDKTNNPMSSAELAKYAPGVDWAALHAGWKIPAQKRIVVGENTAIKAHAALFAETPLETLKLWQEFHVADQASPYLNKRMVDSRELTVRRVGTCRSAWVLRSEVESLAAEAVRPRVSA